MTDMTATDYRAKAQKYLAAADRLDGGRPRQLAHDDIKKMSPKEIVAAHDAGQLDDLLGGKDAA